MFVPGTLCVFPQKFQKLHTLYYCNVSWLDRYKLYMFFSLISTGFTYVHTVCVVACGGQRSRSSVFLSCFPFTLIFFFFEAVSLPRPGASSQIRPTEQWLLSTGVTGTCCHVWLLHAYQRYELQVLRLAQSHLSSCLLALNTKSKPVRYCRNPIMKTEKPMW